MKYSISVCFCNFYGFAIILIHIKYQNNEKIDVNKKEIQITVLNKVV